jgi:hypothetical protein
MEQDFTSLQEIMDKIRNVDRLPSYEEARRLFYFFEDKRPDGKRWFDFCEECGVHNVYNTEFIDKLTTLIKDLNSPPPIEICAGNGKLSYQLRKNGIDIIATDDNSEGLSNGGLVEKLPAQKALEKYKPRIVVAAWIPYQARIGFDVLDSPSVEHFIDIGEVATDTGKRFWGSTWLTHEIYSRTSWSRQNLAEFTNSCICRTDYSDGPRQSCVRLFSRKDACPRK